MKDVIKKIVGLDLSSSTKSTNAEVSPNLKSEVVKPGISIRFIKVNLSL